MPSLFSWLVDTPFLAPERIERDRVEMVELSSGQWLVELVWMMDEGRRSGATGRHYVPRVSASEIRQGKLIYWHIGEHGIGNVDGTTIE